MNVTEEIRKSLSDPKPLYALAGAGDLAAEKLKDAPERLREAPTLLAEASATLTTIANKIAAAPPWRERVEEGVAKATATVQGVAGKAGRPDREALRGAAQSVALQQVGKLLEAAGKAVETYDELAERGKVVVGRYTGGSETVPGETVDDNGPVNVVVEQVIDEDEFEDAPAPETAAEAAEVFEAAAEAEDAQAAPAAKPKPAAAAKKTTPRKRTTAPKTPRTPKA